MKGGKGAYPGADFGKPKGGKGKDKGKENPVDVKACKEAAERLNKVHDGIQDIVKDLGALGTRAGEPAMEIAQAGHALSKRTTARAGANFDFHRQQAAVIREVAEKTQKALDSVEIIVLEANDLLGKLEEASKNFADAMQKMAPLITRLEFQRRVQKLIEDVAGHDRMISHTKEMMEQTKPLLESAREDQQVSSATAVSQRVQMTVGQGSKVAQTLLSMSTHAQHAAPAVQTSVGPAVGPAGKGKPAAAVVIDIPVLPGPERERLPLDEHANKIIKACKMDPVTLIQGETGSGKSSRVPQYIYHCCGTVPEANIVMTQPRRLACVTLAQRIAEEMGESTVGGLVGYRISGDSFTNPRTRIMLVTTGYLLQVLVSDPTYIHRFTHVILDEVHERAIDSDLLSMVLKLQMHHQQTFKLVIMSATLQGGMFAEYFARENKIPQQIFVGVKRFAVEYAYLDDLINISTTLGPELAVTSMDVLRSKTGLYLSPLAITNVNEAMARFNASAAALQKRQGMLAMGQNAAMAAMQMHEDAETEFWRLNQGELRCSRVSTNSFSSWCGSSVALGRRSWCSSRASARSRRCTRLSPCSRKARLSRWVRDFTLRA
jgi:hypothetical protein